MGPGLEQRCDGPGFKGSNARGFGSGIRELRKSGHPL
jgi:hypothetical protein